MEEAQLLSGKGRPGRGLYFFTSVRLAKIIYCNIGRGRNLFNALFN